MKLARRHWLLALALLATLLATWQVSQQGDDEAGAARALPPHWPSHVVSPAGTAAQRGEANPMPQGKAVIPAGADKGMQAANSAGLPLARLERSAPAPSTLNPFAVKSFLPPPPPAPPAVQRVAAAPTAPPLPFSLAGKMQDDGGRWVYYLMRGEQSFAVSEGDTVDANYRLRGVENNSLVIEYIPLAVKQFLPLGSEP